MIAALLLGRKGSVGFPGKNTMPVLGRPLCAYPMLAAINSKYVDKLYISTDDEQIMAIGKKHDADIIVRPRELCTKGALGEDAYVHGYEVIRDNLKAESSKVKSKEIELMVLLFLQRCNHYG